MNKRLSTMLLAVSLMLSSCSYHNLIQSPAAEVSAAGMPAPLGYKFIIFDSDGDGVKDDVAVLTCLGLTGGSGVFKLEIYISGTIRHRKIFDSTKQALFH